MPVADGYYTPDEIAAAALAELNVENPDERLGLYARDQYKGLHAELVDQFGADWPFAMCPLKARHGVTLMLAARCSMRVRGTPMSDQVGRVAYFTAMGRPISARRELFEYF